jgi:hypothetical protein
MAPVLAPLFVSTLMVLVISMLMMFMHLRCAPYSDSDSTVSEDLILPRHLDDISITVG